MDNFRARLAGLVAQRFDTVPERLSLSEQAVTDIMLVIQGAIENAGVAPEIDAWIVRTGLGKQDTRVVRAMLDADGTKSVEMIDRNVEIFTRIYATERECGTFSDEAIKRAHKVVESMMSIGVISGPQ